MRKAKLKFGEALLNYTGNFVKIKSLDRNLTNYFGFPKLNCKIENDIMAEEKFYLTKEGLERLKKEYEELKALRLRKIKERRPEILHSEDSNPEYFAFQEDMGLMDSKLAELKNVIAHSQIIKPPPKEKQNIAQLGALVTLEEKDGKINEFMIVSSLEANPNEGKISDLSPVGKAILGKKIGEEVLITSPIKVVYKIKKIRYYSS